MKAEAEMSWLSAGSARACRLLADPELLEFTFGVIPAIPSKFHAVFFPNIVGLPSIPILLESGESVNKTLVCSRGMLRTMFLASWNSMSHIPLECIWWMGLVLNPGTYLSRWPWILTLVMSYTESVIFRCKPTNLDSTFLTWFLHSGIQLTCPHAKHWTARSQDPEMAN